MLNRLRLGLFITLILFLLVTSCQSEDKNENSYYTIKDSIKITEPALLFPMKLHKNLLFTINIQEVRLEVFSLQGELLSNFGTKGKGPQELLRIESFDVYQNNVYIADRGNRKIMQIQYNPEKNKLQYVKEFRCKFDISDICIIDQNNIFITCWGEKNNIKLYNAYGELTNEYSSLAGFDISKSMDLLETASLIDNIGYNILVSNILNMELQFFEFNPREKKLLLSDQRKVNYPRKSQSANISESRSDIYGLGHVSTTNNNFYISFNPQIEDIKETFFEIYNVNGCYLGNLYLQDYDKVFGPTFFSNNAEILYFMDLLENDTTIYIAEEN